MTNWTRWEGGAGWQATNDAYLQADLTPISAKVAGSVRELPIQDFEHVHKGQVLAQLVDDDYRAAAAQAEAGVATATARRRHSRHDMRCSSQMDTGSSSTEASEKLITTHAQPEAQLKQTRAQALAAERQLAILEELYA